jgi:hypothetical protein
MEAWAYIGAEYLVRSHHLLSYVRVSQHVTGPAGSSALPESRALDRAICQFSSVHTTHICFPKSNFGRIRA